MRNVYQTGIYIPPGTVIPNFLILCQYCAICGLIASTFNQERLDISGDDDDEEEDEQDEEDVEDDEDEEDVEDDGT